METQMDAIPNEVRKKITKLLESYRNMGAVIAAMELDVKSQNLTANYNPSESQRSNIPGNPIESIILRQEKLEEKKRVKQKLDIIFDGFNETEKKIIEMRFFLGRYDDVVIDELNMSRRLFYRIKDGIIRTIGESFYLL